MCWAQWSPDVVQDEEHVQFPHGSGNAYWPALGVLMQKYVQTQAEKLCGWSVE